MPQPPVPIHPTFRLYLLGAFRLEKHGEPVNVVGRKGRALLAYLALHPEPHAREQLAARFWDSATETDARLSLRVNLARLKKIIPNLLLADTDTVQLNPAATLWVDAHEFKDEIQRLKDENATLASSFIPSRSLANHSSSLYSGDLLPEFYDDWVLAEREHLRQLYLDALLDLVQSYRSQSEYEQAIETAHTILQIDRANERACQHVMFCHVAAGDRSAALVQYAACERALREELSVKPSQETTALYTWIQQTPPESRSLSARITNLPIPLTSFIGRQNELRQIKHLMSMTRLVTLTGAGGSGKTRLSIQIGMELLDQLRDGVWWVEFAALTDPSLVPAAIAKTLGVQEVAGQALVETVANVLRERTLLLILDNCEHLITACARVAGSLLTQCPNLKILATSREGLNIGGETIYLVPTLKAPRAETLALVPLLLEFESIRLFVERAQSHNLRFELSETNAPAVAQICRQLDGIPLALELAAARVTAFSVTEIAARLDDRFNLLSRGSRTALPRQQTLRALVDWSYDLLSTEERALFCRLGVFAGGWTLTAAEYINTASDTFALVSQLVEKSLVISEERDGEIRYHFLETIRAYARERLQEQNGRELTQVRHLAFFTTLAEQAYRPAWERQDAKQFAQLEIEHDNLRAGLEFALTHRNIEMALRLSGALGVFWVIRSYTEEGDRWYRQVLDLEEQDAPALRARVLSLAGALKWIKSDFAQAVHLHQQALDLYRTVNDACGIAFSLNNIALQYDLLGNHDAMKGLLEEALAWVQESRDVSLEILLLNNLAAYWERRQERMRAKTLVERSLALARQVSSSQHPLIALNLAGMERALGNQRQAQVYLDEALIQLEQNYDPRTLGCIEREKANALAELGEIAAARLWFGRSLRTFQTSDNNFEFAITLAHLAEMEARTGNSRRAGQVAAYAQKQIIEILAAQFYPSTQARFAQLVPRLRETLGEAEFEQAWAEGRAVSRDEVLALVLQDS